MSKPIVISVLGDVRDLSSKLDSSESKLGRLGSAAGKMGKIAALGFAAAGAAAIAWGADSLKSLARIEQINAQTATAIKSTGGAAGVTAGHVEALAGRLEDLTATEAETTQENANLLLTFTNVQNAAGKGNNIFDKTVSTFVDMQRAIPTASMTSLGKALNDPVKGISALSRVGVAFTEGQKDQIKTLVASGDTMKAQKIILGELNKEFGGSGEAFAGTTTGKIELAKHAFGTLGETIFANLLPPLGALATGATEGLRWLNDVAPKVQAAAAPFTAALLPALSSAGTALTAVLVPALATLGGFVTGTVLPAMTTLGTALAVNVLPFLLNLGTFVATSVLPALVSLGGFLVANVLPVLASLGGFVVGSLLPAFGAFAGFVTGTILPAVMGLATRIAGNLAPIITTLGTVITTRVVPAATLIVAKFREWSPALITVATGVGKVIGFVASLASAILGKVLPVVLRFAGFLIGNLVPVLLGVVGGIIKTIAAVVNFGSALVDGIKAAARFATAVGDKIREVVLVITGIPGKARDALAGVASTLFNSGATLIQGLIDGITSKIAAVRDKMSSLASTIKGFLPGSPVKEGPLTSWNNGGAGARLMDSLIGGLEGRRAAARATMAGIAGDLNDGLRDNVLTFHAAPSKAKTPLSDKAAANSPAAGGSAGGATCRHEITLRAEQMHELERGRRIAIELRPYLAAGGKL